MWIFYNNPQLARGDNRVLQASLPECSQEAYWGITGFYITFLKYIIVIALWPITNMLFSLLTVQFHKLQNLLIYSKCFLIYSHLQWFTVIVSQFTVIISLPTEVVSLFKLFTILLFSRAVARELMEEQWRGDWRRAMTSRLDRFLFVLYLDRFLADFCFVCGQVS